MLNKRRNFIKDSSKALLGAVALVAMFMTGCDRATNSDKDSQVQDLQKEVAMQSDTLKLIFPQWQGGDIAGFFKDLPPSESAKGYILGAQILDLLIGDINPALDKNTAIVDISRDFRVDSKRIVQDGIIDKEILRIQHENALNILHAKNPAKILTLGGECATSVAPFGYLADKYKGEEVAMIWIDAHPDLGVKNDDFYKGYHAMAVSAIIGDSSLAQDFALPAHIKPQNVLFVGLNSNEAKHYDARRESLGIESISGKEFANNEAKAFGAISAWLQARGAKKVLIHLDLDVLNPRELYVAVGDSGVLSIAQVVGAINVVSQNAEVVGLTIAEHLPKAELQLKEMLKKLPLIKG